MKWETKVISYNLLEAKDIVLAAFYEQKKFPVWQECLGRRQFVNEVSLFDFKYCVIMIYILKVGDGAAAGNFRFPYKLWWVKRIFAIEKVLIGIYKHSTET